MTEWAYDGPTDIDNLTFACTPATVSSTTAAPQPRLDHPKHPNGTTQWIPPPQLTLGEERQLTPSY
ncbi:hypothetical protein [Mycobacteroides abscessus]|uniref:hypothetical protein n=1 Tax=Mycobacteroides abscessus TaxID=36809 RepID=UPI003F6E431F